MEIKDYLNVNKELKAVWEDKRKVKNYFNKTIGGNLFYINTLLNMFENSKLYADELGVYINLTGNMELVKLPLALPIDIERLQIIADVAPLLEGIERSKYGVKIMNYFTIPHSNRFEEISTVYQYFNTDRILSEVNVPSVEGVSIIKRLASISSYNREMTINGRDIMMSKICDVFKPKHIIAEYKGGAKYELLSTLDSVTYSSHWRPAKHIFMYDECNNIIGPDLVKFFLVEDDPVIDMYRFNLCLKAYTYIVNGKKPLNDLQQIYWDCGSGTLRFKTSSVRGSKDDVNLLGQLYYNKGLDNIELKRFIKEAE